MGCCTSVWGSLRPQKSSKTVKSLWQEQHLQKHLRFSSLSLVQPAAFGQVQIQQAEGKRGSDPFFLRSDSHSKLPHQCSGHGRRSAQTSHAMARCLHRESWLSEDASKTNGGHRSGSASLKSTSEHGLTTCYLARLVRRKRVTPKGASRCFTSETPTISGPMAAHRHTTQPWGSTNWTSAELQLSFGLLFMLRRIQGWNWFKCLGSLKNLCTSALLKLA